MIAAALLCLPASADNKSGFKTMARHAMLLDAKSGSQLYALNPDEPRPPASMSKLMTLAIIFKALKARHGPAN